jgi:hypothetical protein
MNVPAMRVEPLEEFPLVAAVSLSPTTVAFLTFIPTLCEQKDRLLRGGIDTEAQGFDTVGVRLQGFAPRASP